MRMASILSIILVSLSAPAFADDADVKKQVDMMNSAYLESFNKQDAAGIAAKFATDAILLTQRGPRTDFMRFYEGAFKAGVTHEEATVDRVWALGADTALGTGTWRVTGKDQKTGVPIDRVGFWTATCVREGGEWKFKMLASFEKPPPAK